MKRTRRRFTATFKTKVVIEALKERATIQELAAKFELHPNQISQWKKEFMENADKAFGDSQSSDQMKSLEQEKEELFKQIGRLSMENEWLKKKVL